MSRLSDPIKARRGPRGKYIVSFAEAPGRTFTSPVENDEWVNHRPGPGHTEAIKWGKRNKDRLLAVEEKPLRLQDFCANFFEAGSPWVARMRDKGHVYGERYLAMRQGHIDNYIIPLIGDEDPREVSGRTIDDAIRLATKRGGKALAPATKYKIVYTLNIILEDLIETKIIDRNPLEGIKAYSKAPVNPRGTISRKSIPVLFPPTHGELVRRWGSPMWGSIMLVFHDTGMRPIETGRLRWSNLCKEDFRDDDGLEHELWSFVFQGAKGHGMRAVGISKRTAQELLIWRAESRWAKEEDYIFTANGSKPITDAAILQAFRRVVAEAIGPEGAKWTTYWLRHTFVSHSISTLTEIEVSMLAGHSVQVDRDYQHPDAEVALARTRAARMKLENARGKRTDDVLK